MRDSAPSIVVDADAGKVVAVMWSQQAESASKDFKKVQM